MKEAANDNEELSFIMLSAATKNVTRYLSKEDHPPQNEERPKDRNDSGGSDKRPEQQPDKRREYVEHRLRELAAWERKVSGR